MPVTDDTRTPLPFALIEHLRGLYLLDWDGIHGWPHWQRVRENGLRLAGATGADLTVVEMFALLHDVARWNNGWDPEHGRRAAALLGSLPRDLVPLDPAQLELLAHACTHHTEGLLEADVTVQTCWDADRLDLGRVGTRPLPHLLCTAAARHHEVITWAWRRSISGG